MLERVMVSLACVAALALGACKAHIKLTVNPLEPSIEFDGEWTPGLGEPADPGATPMGSGTVSLEGGGTLTGEFYDTDGDGKPDKFKPDEGQGDPDGALGTTDGVTWFDLERVEESNGKRSEETSEGGAPKK